MSAFHAFFSLGGVLASLLGGGFIAAGVDVRLSLAVAAVIGVLVVLRMQPHLLPAPPRTRSPGSPHGRVPWSGRVLLLGLLAFALLLAEGVGYDWSTVHLHDSLEASKAVAAWAFGAFSIAMTAVRLLADRLVARFGPGPFVRVAAWVGAAALTGAALAPDAPTAIAAWAVFGVGLAGCTPQFFTAAGAIDGGANHGTHVARVAGFGYVGLLAGPASIGLLTTWVPLTTAFVVPIACCVLAALLATTALSRPGVRA